MGQIGMFVILGLLASPHQLLAVLVPGLLISAALILVARPVAVFACLLPFRFRWREQLYIAWIGLRGSVPIVLATYPWLAGLENAQLFFNIAFRSEEHTSELESLMRISYAVFCLKKKTTPTNDK